MGQEIPLKKLCSALVFAHLFWPRTILQETMQPGFQCFSVLQKIQSAFCACSLLPMFCVNFLHHNTRIEPKSSLASNLALTTGIPLGTEVYSLDLLQTLVKKDKN